MTDKLQTDSLRSRHIDSMLQSAGMQQRTLMTQAVARPRVLPRICFMFDQVLFQPAVCVQQEPSGPTAAVLGLI